MQLERTCFKALLTLGLLVTLGSILSVAAWAAGAPTGADPRAESAGGVHGADGPTLASSEAPVASSTLSLLPTLPIREDEVCSQMELSGSLGGDPPTIGEGKGRDVIHGRTETGPAAPFLLAPGAAVFPGTTTTLLSPTFWWLEVPGADSYQFELSDDFTTLPLESIGAPQTSFVFPSSLLNSHDYKWRMRSHGLSGFGPFGEYYYFSVYTGQPPEDFTIFSVPTASSGLPGESVPFTLGTTTLLGSPQTLALSTGALPTGVTATLSPSTIQSGQLSTLTLDVGAQTAPGSYAVTILSTHDLAVTHTVTVGLTVNPLPVSGEPAVCLTPGELGFSDQQVGTSSPTQSVTLRNCGSGPLHVSSIGASPEFFLGAGSIVPPVDLVAGSATSFQAGFAPLDSGLRAGSVKIFSNAAGSPTVLPLTGTGTPSPLTTGTINVEATLNGAMYTGTVAFEVTGPGGSVNFGNVPLSWPNQAEGSYTVSFIAAPPGGGILAGISPASTQTLAPGGSLLFTLEFTAPNEFGFSCPTSLVSERTEVMVAPAGGTASIPLRGSYIRGGSQSLTLAVEGLPPGTTGFFDPQPLEIPLGQASSDSTFTAAVGASTPPGIFEPRFSATNQDGTAHFLTGTLVVVGSTLPELVSRGSGSVQADDFSEFPSMSTDGRYVAFESPATNLVSGDTNGATDIFVRDRFTGTLERVSLGSGESQADDGSFLPAISSHGRFVAFQSVARNLVPEGPTGSVEIYVRDRELGLTTRVSVSSSGMPADATSIYPSISGDGRYVAFQSTASNLVPGMSGGISQIYVHDLMTGTTSLVSVAEDGSAGDGDSTQATVSGDGRFVAFYSKASNFSASAGATGSQVFERDLLEGTTRRVSSGLDGAPPNIGTTPRSLERLAVSPDGRYVAFSSVASNLVADDDDFADDVFRWNRLTGETALVSRTSEGRPMGGNFPSISADGRRVAFIARVPGFPSPQVTIRDMVTSQTVVYSVGPGSVLGSAFSSVCTLSSNGRVLSFSSVASNLVAGDTNGQQDIFSVDLPRTVTPFVQSISVSPASLVGGMTAIGTVTLSDPAPAGGASVEVSSSDPGVHVPGITTIAAGALSSSFTVSSLPVASPRSVALIASYGGGSPWALLELEPSVAARVDAVQGNDQKAVVGTAFPTRLAVRVVDSGNNPVAGQTVHFSAPTMGPSGTFPGSSTSVDALTDSSGVALAPTLVGNNTPGAFTVTATVDAVAAPAVFALTNLGTEIFASGFEKGDLSEWSGVVP